jgi:hypothetical protein
MKKSSTILVVLFVLFTLSLLASNIILKDQYNRIDKTDPFWNYAKLQTGSFHHVDLSGTNFTRTSFIQSPHGSVGALSFQEQMIRERFQTKISGDTLYVTSKNLSDPPNMRDWMKGHILIAISCPQLFSISLNNSNLDVFKLRQSNISVGMSGRSRMEIESSIPDFDSISIQQKDSSVLKFEMSEDIKSSGVMHANVINIRIQGYSITDLGHFQIGQFHPVIDDSSAVTVSGRTLESGVFAIPR